MPSSLETFLAGKNPYLKWPHDYQCPRLVGTQTLHQLAPDVPTEELFQRKDGEIWLIDVLDDGTAINYCIEVEDDDPFYSNL
jgi:hypothetical protein